MTPAMNRRVALLPLLFSLLAACAQASGSSTSNVTDDRLLTEDEEKQVLTEIDNICGDTWCEGDFDFSFNALDCRTTTSSCRFDFELIDRVYDDAGDQLLEEHRYPASC